MKYFISFILLTTLFFELKAQNYDSTSLNINYYLGPYFSYQPINNLNTVLKSVNLSPFNNYSAGFNFGGSVGKKHLAIGIDYTLATFLNYLIGNNNNNSYVAMAQIFFKYDIISKKDFCVYPIIGLGFTGISNKIFKDLNNASFTNVISGTGNAAMLINSSPTINLSIGFDNYKQGLIVYRIGYNYSPSSSSWHSPVGNFTNAPSDNISNFYFMIQIGGKSRFVKK